MPIKPSRVTVAVDSQCTISAVEKSGGLLAPFFASRVAEAMENLSEVAEETEVDPLQHVPGLLNPADIPTRSMASPDDVKHGSTWQSGPEYLKLPREQWPFSREFIDTLPASELRAPKAVFHGIAAEEWQSCLGPRISKMVLEIMIKSNCYSKTVNVTARLIKGIFSRDGERIKEMLSVQDIQVARLCQFMVSMGPSLIAMDKGQLDSLRPIVEKGIVYVRG